MNNVSRLYDDLVKFVSQLPWSDRRHLYVLVWMVVGAIAEGSVNLTRWITTVETNACYAQSTQRRFQRWLYNARINVARLYSPLIQAALSSWEDESLYLSFDTSLLWNEYCIIRVSVVYRGRAVPVGWRVIRHRSSSVKLSAYRELLKRISKLLPDTAKVILLADRGFIDAKLCHYVRQTLGWHYRMRLKGTCWFWRPRQGWKQLRDFHLSVGEAWLFQGVRVHKRQTIRDTHLALAYEASSGEYWYILSSEATTLQTFREYGRRFDIEENFLDDKSNGFELEASKLRSAPVLSRLCLVLAVATLYLTLQGTEVVSQGQRRRVDPHWFRGSSYLKLGWRWVKAALARGWQLFESLGLITQVDPEPAIASQRQHSQRTLRFEFTVRSRNYSS